MLKYNEGESLETHFLKFDGIIREYKIIKKNFEDEDAVVYLVSGIQIERDCSKKILKLHQSRYVDAIF